MIESVLSSKYLGLTLKNPVMISAGPWSHDAARIKKGFKAGASAVITTSIVNDARPPHRPRLFLNDNHLGNIKLYSEKSLEDWKRIIGEIKDSGGTLIASIMGETPSEIAYLAERVERFGADAIEIGAASPHGEGVEIKCSDPEFVYSYTSLAVETVNIPVSIKLAATITNPVAVAKAAEAAGAQGISGIDAVRSLIGIDIEHEKPFLPSLGGLSGSSIKPISLALTSIVSGSVKTPACGIGGVGSYEDVLDYIMSGASAVQVGSSILTNGFENITRIIEDLHAWLDKKGYKSIKEIKGKANRGIISFQDLKSEPLAAEIKTRCTNSECLKCMTACMYDSISNESGHIEILRQNCSGCGMCVTVCPEKLIQLGWYEK